MRVLWFLREHSSGYEANAKISHDGGKSPSGRRDGRDIVENDEEIIRNEIKFNRAVSKTTSLVRKDEKFSQRGIRMLPEIRGKVVANNGRYFEQNTSYQSP